MLDKEQQIKNKIEQLNSWLIDRTIVLEQMDEAYAV